METGYKQKITYQLIRSAEVEAVAALARSKGMTL